MKTLLKEALPIILAIVVLALSIYIMPDPF